jgi:hypothetical protein
MKTAGPVGWQKSSGSNLRAKVVASIGRYKRVIGDALRSRTDQTEATEVAIAAATLGADAMPPTPSWLYAMRT